MAKGTFGERLKRERELREVSVNELTKSTRISQRFLEALENEDWAKLPGGVFGRAFVRTIARYLGLDEESFLAEYDAARGDVSQGKAAEKQEQRIPSPPRWIPVGALFVVLALLAALVYAGRYAWRRYEARHAQQKSSVSAEAPLSELAAIAPAAAGPPAVVLDAEVPAGESLHFRAQDHFEIAAADSSAVLLELNGQAMPPLGAPGASGTMVLSQQDLRQASRGNSQP